MEVVINRNDECFCGSGLKYKKCCLGRRRCMKRYVGRCVCGDITFIVSPVVDGSEKKIGELCGRNVCFGDWVIFSKECDVFGPFSSESKALREAKKMYVVSVVEKEEYIF